MALKCTRKLVLFSAAFVIYSWQIFSIQCIVTSDNKAPHKRLHLHGIHAHSYDSQKNGMWDFNKSKYRIKKHIEHCKVINNLELSTWCTQGISIRKFYEHPGDECDCIRFSLSNHKISDEISKRYFNITTINIYSTTVSSLGRTRFQIAINSSGYIYFNRMRLIEIYFD